MALTDFKGQLIADTGISMGDEGKGRLVYEVIDELKAKTGRKDIAAIVLKVNGGANSGHTAGGVKLNLLPAGVIEADVKILATGAGVVADPRKFAWEGGSARSARLQNFQPPAHRRAHHGKRPRPQAFGPCMGRLRVNKLNEEPRGSTGRGITPSYMDEVGQFQICYCDFCGPKDVFAKKLSNKLRRGRATNPARLRR